MSSNKGKDGELRTIIVIANIGISEDGVDFTRPTTTNTADQGADIFMTHPSGFLNKFSDISDSKLPPLQSEDINNPQPTAEKSRIDVKTTDKKLQKDTVQKFIADCANHPNCRGQILMGGADLTGPGHKVFEAAQESFSKKGKILLYVKNEGIKKLEAYYKPQIEGNSEGK